MTDLKSSSSLRVTMQMSWSKSGVFQFSWNSIVWIPAVQYSTVQHSTVQYSTAKHSVKCLLYPTSVLVTILEVSVMSSSNNLHTSF